MISVRFGVVIAVAAFGAVVPAASADTFCVNHSGCVAGPGHNFTKIADAIAAAGANGAASVDAIAVGPGVYDEKPTDNVGNPVAITGSGDSTVIAPSTSTNNQTALTILEPGTTVSSLEVTVPAGTGNTGVGTNPSAGAHGPSFSHVDVNENATASSAVGVSLYGSSFSNGAVALTDGNSLAADLNDSSVAGSSLSAGGTGAVLFQQVSPSVSVVRSRITGGADGVFDIAPSALLADDLIQVTSATGVAARLANSSGGQTLALDQDTLVGPGTGSSVGANAGNGSPVEASLTLNIDGTIIRGFGTDLLASGNATGPNVATINVKYSDFNSAKVSPATNTTTSIVNKGPGNLNNVDPLFANPSAADYALQPSSPVIDKSDPSAPLADEPTTDLAGNPRKAREHPGTTARVDMGAFEFQPVNRPPVASFIGPAKGTVGKPVTFDGSASHDPDHDPLSFAWRFGDGGSSTARKPAHTYKKPGTYHVSLVVTDGFGAKSATVSRTIVVSRPACVVPKLHGKTLSDAKRALSRANCALGTVTRKRSKTIPKGEVISSSPAAGTRHPVGTRVALTVSRGKH